MGSYDSSMKLSTIAMYRRILSLANTTNTINLTKLCRNVLLDTPITARHSSMYKRTSHKHTHTIRQEDSNNLYTIKNKNKNHVMPYLDW